MCLSLKLNGLQPRPEDGHRQFQEDLKQFKANKEQVKREKEQLLLNEQMKRSQTVKSPKSPKVSKREKIKVVVKKEKPPEVSEERVKKKFTSAMATVMVGFLNPYKRADCQQGRINSTEDFKHLARKVYV